MHHSMRAAPADDRFSFRRSKSAAVDLDVEHVSLGTNSAETSGPGVLTGGAWAVYRCPMYLRSVLPGSYGALSLNDPRFAPGHHKVSPIAHNAGMAQVAGSVPASELPPANAREPLVAKNNNNNSNGGDTDAASGGGDGTAQSDPPRRDVELPKLELGRVEDDAAPADSADDGGTNPELCAGELVATSGSSSGSSRLPKRSSKSAGKDGHHRGRRKDGGKQKGKAAEKDTALPSPSSSLSAAEADRPVSAPATAPRSDRPDEDCAADAVWAPEDSVDNVQQKMQLSVQIETSTSNHQIGMSSLQASLASLSQQQQSR